ncbi:MAG: hypothetical protein U0Q12_02470 [Vicinamibacterales bacterium]
MLRTCSYVGACVLALASVEAAAQGPPDARKALDAGEPLRAVERFRAATAATPSDIALQASLAVAELDAGDADAALETAQAAAKAAPNSPDAQRALALVRLGRQELALAHAVLDKALEAQPADAGLLLAKGQLAWRERRTATALDALTKAARSSAWAAEAQLWLGRIATFKGWQQEGAFPGWHDESEYRPDAIRAFEAAAGARPDWYAPRVGLGEALLLGGRPAEALGAFDAALARGPRVAAALIGRWRALEALGRVAEIEPEVAKAAAASDAALLGAAREGYALLGKAADADAVDARIVENHPRSEAAEAVLTRRLEAAAKAKQTASVVEQATAFVSAHPQSARLLGVYDQLLAAYQTTPGVPAERLVAAIDARTSLQPDPGAFFGGASLLLTHKVLFDKCTALAKAGEAASETFITENASAYKLDGKVQASRERGRATAADLEGWAAFLGKDLATAARRLTDADRLSRSTDMANQFHLGELLRAQGQLEAARSAYLNALTLAAGPPLLKEAAKRALADVHVALGNQAADVDAYLATEIGRRRESRRSAMVESMVGKPVPAFTATDLKGRPVDLLAERGNVVLLNFFASW